MFGFLHKKQTRARNNYTTASPGGITLIETIIGIAIFAIIGSGIFSTYTGLSRLSKMSQIKVALAAVGSEYLEITRNLSYTSLGVSGGIPSGVLPANQTVTRGINQFNVHYLIRSIDDPFDGTVNGSPHDSSPADYKQVTVEVSCLSCGLQSLAPQKFSTYIAPKNLESNTNNGALVIQVIDANGQPLPGANVHIANTHVSPVINFDDITNNDGLLQIVDAPPANQAYHIVVTKAGYSTDQTYDPSDLVVINPIKIDATVVAQQVTQLTFAIDKVSLLNVSSINQSCSAVPNIAFNLTGSKLIGLNPNVYKYNQNLTTGATGTAALNNLEWDTYNLTVNDTNYESIGFIPLLPINLAPNSSQDQKIVIHSKSPHSLLTVVKDASSQLPLSGASVHLTKPGYDETIITSRGYLRQTSWKDGPGQTSFIDEEKYFSNDGHINDNNPAGEIRLKKTGRYYDLSGTLISSTFDAGAATNFATIGWQPGDQPAGVGATPVKMQIATNTDNTTWNFIGPDGTANTYYTVPGQTVSSLHNGDRYLRYKVILSTENSSKTPNISDISVTYVSTCSPPGQAFFTGLSSATYTLQVSLDGYQTATTTADLSPDWTKTEVNLIPL